MSEQKEKKLVLEISISALIASLGLLVVVSFLGFAFVKDIKQTNAELKNLVTTQKTSCSDIERYLRQRYQFKKALAANRVPKPTSLKGAEDIIMVLREQNEKLRQELKNCKSLASNFQEPWYRSLWRHRLTQK